MDNRQASLIRVNYQRVLEELASAAHRAGHDPGRVQLVTVTKGHPIRTLLAALEVGICRFGENYAEEGAEKVASITAAAGSLPVEWHMIGHVQSRKASMVAENFVWVHSVDSLKLARRLDTFSGNLAQRLNVLLECNVSGETSKFGWAAWDERQWPELLPEVETILALPNLDLRGLMTMAPFFDSPEPARPYFARLRALRDYLVERLAYPSLTELSMGMSGDFTVAVEEGATMVRIGTAILGDRPGI